MPESNAALARFIIPTGLTLANAIAGLAAILSIHRYDPQDLSTWSFLYWSISLLFLAMIFDALDGLAARLMRSTSDFGAELDSLCDGISFGLVPAYLLWSVYGQGGWLLENQIWGILITLYLSCTLLRLARFNLQRTIQDKADGKKFIGLPSPAAAGCICTLVLLQGRIDVGLGISTSHPRFELVFGEMMRVLAPLAAFFVSILMISSVPFPHPSRELLGNPKSSTRKRKAPLFPTSVLVLLIVCAFTRSLDLMMVAGFWGFAIRGLLQWSLGKPKKKAQSNEVSARLTT